MLEASSEHHHHHHRHNLSRVCGHGHIKKFWLMQTQKETESEDVTRNQTNRILEENKLTPLSSNCQNSYFSCGDDSPTGGSISTSGNNEDQLSARDALVNRDFIDSSAQPLSVSERLEVSSGTDCRDNIKIVASHSDRESTCKAGYTQVAREFLCKDGKGHLHGNEGDNRENAECLSNEENGMESADIRFPHGDASVHRHSFAESRNKLQRYLDDDKSIRTTDVSSQRVNTFSQVSRIMDVRNKGLGHTESNKEERIKGCTGYASSPPHRKFESRTKALNHGDLLEGKCMEDVALRSITSITTSPCYRKLQSRNRGGLDPILLDEGKYIESSQERDMSSPKVCTLCGATKTPMWRSGPQGPKSLCNACGIRYKKYRVFSGPACDASDLTSLHPTSPPPSKGLTIKKRKQSIGTLLPHEPSPSHKKSKWHQQLHQLVIKRDQADLLSEIPSAWKVSSGPASLKKIYGCMPSRFKNLGPMEDHLTVKRVFAKDEEEAAVLLMDLSCGLAF